MRASLDRNAQAVASLLRKASPKADAKIPGLEWTASDLGAHLITEPRRFDRFGRGVVETLDDVASFNREELDAIAEKDPAKQADVFLAEHASYMTQAAKYAPSDPYQWFGWDMDWSQGAGIYLGELCIHTLDLSRLLGERVTLDRQDAIWIINGLVPILPRFADPVTSKDFTGTFELRLRKGPSVVMSFAEGSVTVAPKDGQRVDCVINADPAAFLLVGYGRTSQWGPILRGKLLAAGRKPWLALRFSNLLVNP
jgi:uncharacterized protein (TIGR03083 family)